ncbi:recombinase family protein [Colwellia sp. 4_MG-2023]|uniref:recombinase family protein n=1 Tax=unclassified Colwellia TaxID=196834 RepID=UPI0026E2F7BB|nr:MULTISPECIES: recombinase zinc beta ribbon domain-containing protein [unclassified Colwellia]MDO6508690.1 recombinase family protein [Colwellia sp. 5_MG-2023]MDO6557338.1 recombinase family protein [Colwellia sp. 4_MG-2023]
MSKIRKAYLYQRFSSDAQKGNSSLFRQTDSQEAWLKTNPDVVVEDKLVDDGLSGFKGHNLSKGSLGVLVDQIEQGLVEKGSLILVEQFSRLSRQSIEKTEELLRKIWTGGITVVTVRDNQHYPPESVNDMSKRIKLLVEIESAYKDSEWRSEKVKASYVRRESNAKEGITPKMRRAFWLTPEGKLNEKHTVIYDLFNLYKGGLGQHRIIQELQIKYPNVEEVQRMNPTTVMYWIKSDTVRGIWRGNKVYDAAVTDELCFNVRSIHQNRLHKNVQPDRKWFLSGLVQCGHCGKGMSIQQTQNSAPVLRCSGKQRKGGEYVCDMKSTFPYQVAYHYFMLVVKRELLTTVINNANKKADVELLEKTKQDHLAKTDELKGLEKAYEKLISDGNDITWISGKLGAVQTEQNNLNNEIVRLQNAISHSNDFDFKKYKGKQKELWDNPKELNLLLQRLQQKMVIKDKEISFQNCRKMKYQGFSQKDKSYKTVLGLKDRVDIPSQSLSLILKSEKIKGT